MAKKLNWYENAKQLFTPNRNRVNYLDRKVINLVIKDPELKYLLSYTSPFNENVTLQVWM